MPTGIGADRLYAELTGSIDCAVNSIITLTHDLWMTPDDVDIWCTDDLATDQPVFFMTSKTSSVVQWIVSGTSRTINYRCYARKNHTIIDSVVFNDSLAVSGGPVAGLSPHDTLKSRSLFDFGTTAQSVSA